ncbi:MAG: type III pantothenate kinase [Chitinophagaceae bacterium]|nr:type III pantothenate kinase [Chitinophagaceae bacterium]
MLPVSLCLDFGNTTLKAAVFTGDKMTDRIEFTATEALATIADIINTYKPEKSILSSVVHHDRQIENLLYTATRFILLDKNTRLPFLNAYGSPETLGNDRLALVAALGKQFPRQDSVVISIGTCITYNFLAKNNAFRGGAISPGINLRLRSMYEFTDRLPLIQRDGHLPMLGYDTDTSIRSGAINGIAAEIDGMLNNFTEQYGTINAVLTGGDSPFFESRLKSKIFVDTNFLFKGLYAILDQYN